MRLLPLPIDTRAGGPSLYGPPVPSGDHTELETPVPIPNTAVKQLGPMVVPLARE